jgi:hypothetical protein
MLSSIEEEAAEIWQYMGSDVVRKSKPAEIRGTCAYQVSSNELAPHRGAGV